MNGVTTVQCYARLNFGLIDLSELPHRIDGSHGMYTGLLAGRVELCSSKKDNIRLETEYTERLSAVVARCRNYMSHTYTPINLSVKQELPSHSGLGGGTQLALSVVESFNREFDLKLSLDEKAYLAQSGGTSGVGSYCFANGGYILEAGRLYPSEKSTVGPSENFSYDKLAPLLAHISVPNWFLCIAIPKHCDVVYGDRESELFQKYTPISVNEVDEQCKWILKGILPALLTEDLPSFSRAVERIMELGFRAKEIETFGAPHIRAMQMMKDLGLQGVGMSSFGPSIFGFSDDLSLAQDAHDKLHSSGSFEKIFLTTPRNRGADVNQSD